MLGINPQINISNVKTIKSPLLAWSRNNAYLTFRYIMTTPFPAIARKTVICYRDLGGNYIQRRWFSTMTIQPRGKGNVCVGVVNPYRYRDQCKTFRVELVVGANSGILGIDCVNFGGYEVCREHPIKKNTMKCDFEEDSCGIRTDFCSLHDWTIQERRSGLYGQKMSLTRSTGLPLLKRDVTGNSCSYAVCIPCFQPSGIEVITSLSSPRVDINSGPVAGPVPGPVPRLTVNLGAWSLFLDPSNSPGEVAGPAILSLPEVLHHPSNQYIGFYYEMVAGGLHSLIVRALCTAVASNYIVPLRPSGVEYHIPNDRIDDTSGFTCVNIHEYVKKDACSSFTIQLHGAARDTALIVDNVSFSEDLHLSCSKEGGYFNGMLCNSGCFICLRRSAQSVTR
jgi:hypothetical protein